MTFRAEIIIEESAAYRKVIVVSHHKSFVIKFLICICFLAISFNNVFSKDEPVALFLTWQQDPTSTMTIDWHTLPTHDAQSIVIYRKKGNSEWKEKPANSHAFPHSDRTIHRLELTELEPGSVYQFKVGEFERIYKFRTMPIDLSKPLRFITGGDTDHERHVMSAVAMQYDPDFILWGGDLSYANGDPARIERWYGWFAGIMENLISPEGRVVPIIVAIGNHEYFQVRRLYIGRSPHHEHTEEEARAFMEKYDLWDMKVTFFFDLFAFPGGVGIVSSGDSVAHDILDFGDYMSLIILDSDHVNSVDGDQTAWLKNILAERQSRSHLFPVYHRGGYPSHQDFNSGTPTRIRTHWAPLFEKYGVRVAFENHDHTYKRTYPVRKEKIHSNGIVFLGDGAWGVSTKSGDNKSKWFMSEFASTRHGIVVTIQGTHQHFLVVDEYGDIIDEYPSTGFVKNRSSD